MPFVKVYIHFVWSTKNREPFLDSPEIRQKVWQHIKENAKTKEIYIDTINGKENLCRQKFEWQDEYFAISVSESMVDKVREYIKNQEEHHGRKPFKEEYDLLMEKHGFKNLKDN